MRRALLSTGLAILAAPLPLSAQPREIERPVTYQCDDLVVIGSFNNNDDYQHVDIEDDILGHGWMTARIRVRRVLFGALRERVLAVRYFGHTYYREDREFVLVVHPVEAGSSFIRSAHLIDGDRRPRLQRTCG